MKNCVLDASAILRFVEDGPGAARVEELILQAQSGTPRVLLSAVNWGEVHYVIARRQSEEKAASFSAQFRNLPIEIMAVDHRAAERAGMFRRKFSLPYADAFAASLAAKEGATLVTADYDFKNVESVIRVEFLPAKRERSPR